MKTRIITAIVLLCIFVPVLLFSDTIIFPIFVSAVSLMAVFEYLKCLGYDKKYALSAPAFLISVALPFLSEYKGGREYVSFVTTIFFVYLFYLFTYAVLEHGKVPFATVGIIFTGVLYIVCAMVSIMLLRRMVGGEYLYLLIFIGAWVTDTFAYFTGRFFGKHKLIEEVSPKKTVEGSIGGIIFCLISYIIFGYIVKVASGAEPNYIALALSAIVISVVSQIGDLIFSLIKREYGIKDYGKIFPGHGGMLDRIDSIIPVSILLYILVSIGGSFSFFA